MATGAIALAGLAVTALSTGVSYMGMKRQSEAQQNALEYNQKVNLENAKQAEAEAHEQIRRDRRANKKALARQRQAYADAGVLEEGSPLTVAADTAALMELEHQDTMYQAGSQSRGFRTQAGFNKMQAGSIKSGTKYALAGTLLSGTNQAISSQL